MTWDTTRAGVDAIARQNKPAKPYPGNTRLKVLAGEFESFLRLKSPAPRRAAVPYAEIVLTQDGDVPAGDVTVQVHQLAAGDENDIKERRLNWNNRPTGVVGGAIASVTKTAPDDGTEWVFPVTTMYQAIANGDVNNGIRLKSTAGTIVKFYGLGASKHRPYLRVQWTTGPQKPVQLSPSYAAVSVPKWVQTCDYVDRSGVDTCTAVQVQIDPTGTDFAVDVWDSGEVASTLPQLDLATTTYPGLADGASTNVRMRVQDNSGKWSPWSDPVTVSRVAKGVITLDAPAPGALATVSEFTPPIIWSFSKTQRAWRVQVVAVDNPRLVLADSGKQPGDGNSWTIPARVLTTNRTFRLILWLWDDEVRESTAGDRPYAELAQDFHVVLDAGVTPADSVTVAQVGDSPVVAVTMTRSAAAGAPDSWTVTRKEVGMSGAEYAVAVDVDIADNIIGVLTWQVFDHSARPGVEYEYRVRAEVNGALSSVAPVATIKTQVSGIWLWDEDGPLAEYVVLGGKEFQADMLDRGGVFYGQGSLEVIRAITGQNGLAGTCSNLLIRTRAGRTWREYEEQMYDFKDRPTAKFRMCMGTTNIPVLLGDVTVRDHPDTQPSLDSVLLGASFSWWQSGEHPFGKVA